MGVVETTENYFDVTVRVHNPTHGGMDEIKVRVEDERGLKFISQAAAICGAVIQLIVPVSITKTERLP